jgi:hypothetical protein
MYREPRKEEIQRVPRHECIALNRIDYERRNNQVMYQNEEQPESLLGSIIMVAVFVFIMNKYVLNDNNLHYLYEFIEDILLG